MVNDCVGKEQVESWHRAPVRERILVGAEWEKIAVDACVY